MMILPLADALQNCLQDLTSRIAGVDNEQMAGRAMGMGAMLGYSVGAIKEQFNSSNGNAKSGASEGGNSGGLQGFIGRAKSVINPAMNLTSEKDYNGNVNPIRDVIPKEKITNTVAIPTSNGRNKENMSNGSNNTPKSVVGKVAKTGYNATKAYLSMGAKMAEGDFSKSPYKANNQSTRKNHFQNTEYISNVVTNNAMQKLGDENEFKGRP